jgi:hypothetical protein
MTYSGHTSTAHVVDTHLSLFDFVTLSLAIGRGVWKKFLHKFLIKILLELQIWECYARGWTRPGDSLSLKALDRLF